MVKQSTFKVYEGPSAKDPDITIMVLITGLVAKSKNEKTGAMVQSYILLRDVEPHIAIKTGQDEAVCGDCPLRPYIFKRGEVSPKRCYVKTYRGPLATYRANKDLPVDLETAASRMEGRRFRKGTYGDPAMVPDYVWITLEGGITGTTGYTHQWKDVGATMQALAMASVHGEEETRLAWSNGWRTFRVLQPGESMLKGEINCPASKEAGRLTTCEECNLCNGKQGAKDNRKSIAIYAH